MWEYFLMFLDLFASKYHSLLKKVLTQTTSLGTFWLKYFTFLFISNGGTYKKWKLIAAAAAKWLLTLSLSLMES